jgi:hypothetical protein
MARSLWKKMQLARCVEQVDSLVELYFTIFKYYTLVYFAHMAAEGRGWGTHLRIRVWASWPMQDEESKRHLSVAKALAECD